MKLEITELRSNTVWNLYRMRDRIQIDPLYQRLSNIWTPDNRQLLIDTVINDLDIPKIYLHKFDKPLVKNGKNFDYAIIDGKQRLETMWAFMDGNISLAGDFQYFKNPTIKAGNMTYSELGREYPDLKVQFDSFQLAVILVETDELEMIEEMFSRLNEAAPLTAPEKRNAYGGPLPIAIRTLAAHPLFIEAIPFPNRRYRHFDLATKFLLAENEGKVVDTKKAYLDKFVESFANQSRKRMPSFLKSAKENADRMRSVFTQRDPLLRQVGMVMLYYHLFRLAYPQGWTGRITRKRLAEFEKLREANRVVAEQDLTRADYDLIEFDRYAQSPNDAYAVKFRLVTLLRKAFQRDASIDDL